MKVGPTLDGRLRIDAEDDDDWFLLGCIAKDAAGDSLAERYGEMMDGEVAEDWREYVVPDLAEQFEGKVRGVQRAIDEAREGGSGQIWVTRETAFDWYGALNLARLALEERYRFGPGRVLKRANQDPERYFAYIRSGFYSAIQSMLLGNLMK
jgi:hypothetical protein